ncbi:hypothetical protein QT970_10005 [Microcoleus sp. herbarium8]|uniref:nSTAND1 domain-containing NTPase n=1 Tax=Microcoleus sp. herbarium8 TaxID=3055436 RepID=UPI002FD766BD
MSAFREKDAHLFFGREEFVQQLVNAVKQHPLVPVIGASGSGKSSVVFAGLIPRLRAEGTWLIESFRPNKQPFYELAAAVISQLEPELVKTDKTIKAKKLAKSIRQDGFTGDVSAILKDKPGKRLLLVVDQFEELYTGCADTEQQQFVDALLAAIKLNPCFKLVLTIRTDFLDYIINDPPFKDVALKPDTPQYLGAMNDEKDIKSVIELTDDRRTENIVKLEEGLTDTIWKDVKQEPGNLPLLEFALTQLWEKNGGGILTNQTYIKIGGVNKALANHADDIYKNLKDPEKKQFKQIFVQLARPGEFVQPVSPGEKVDVAEEEKRRGQQSFDQKVDIAEEKEKREHKSFVTPDTRRLATRAEIGEGNWRLVQKLAGEDIPDQEKKLPLLVTGRNENTGEQTVEVVHEALIREWEELQGWINYDRAFLTWRDLLRINIAQWKKGEASLLRDQPLITAEDWLQQRPEDLTNEREYIQQSLDFQQREKDQKKHDELEKLKVQSKLETEQENSQILTSANQRLTDANQEAEQKIRYGNVYLAVSIVVGVLFLGSAAIAIHKQQEAQKGTQLEQAGVNALFQFKSGELSSLVSAMQSAQGLQNLIGNRRDLKDYPAVSPVLAVQKILDDIHEQNYFEAGQGEVKSAVFLPGDKGFITAGEGKENKEDTLQMWNFAGKKEVSLQGHEGGLLSGVNAVSVGGNAQNPVIASAGEDGTVRLWDKSGRQTKQLVAEGESFSAIAVSLDGQKIIAGQRNGTVYLWDKSGKQLLKTWAAHGSYITTISFSKDGQTLATAGGEDGLARIWTVTGNKLGELKHPQIKKMLGVSLSPDGQFVATASDDNRARIWTVNGQEVRRLEGHQGWVTVVNFSPNGQSIATGSNDGIVKLWNAKTGENLQNFRGHRGVVLTASFSRDGKRLVSAGRDGFVRLWNLADRPVQRLELTGFKDDVNAIAFSPDGKTIAGAGDEGVMRLWDAKSGKELKVWKEAIQRISKNPSNVQDIAFSPDGKFIVAGGLNVPIARVWNLKGSLTEPQANLNTNKETQEIHQGDIMTVAVSPDSQLVATGSSDNIMRIWKPKSPNGELVKVTQKQENLISTVLFAPDKKQIVTADGDGYVAFWDLDGNQINKWKNLDQTQISGLAITPDGNQIVTADKTGNVKISDRYEKKQKEFFSYQSGINELAISPDGKLIATGGMDGTVRLWDFQGRQVAEFRNPKGAIWGIAFSPNSLQIALAGDNGFVSVRRIDSLSDLMQNGCTWLKDYLTLNYSEKDGLKPSQKDSIKICNKKM